MSYEEGKTTTETVILFLSDSPILNGIGVPLTKTLNITVFRFVFQYNSYTDFIQPFFQKQKNSK